MGDPFPRPPHPSRKPDSGRRTTFSGDVIVASFAERPELRERLPRVRRQYASEVGHDGHPARDRISNSRQAHAGFAFAAVHTPESVTAPLAVGRLTMRIG